VTLERNEDGGAHFTFQFPAPDRAKILTANLT